MRRTASVLLAASITATALVATSSPGTADPGRGAGAPAPLKRPVATGYGGAVSSVDADASAAGIEVLRRGGNAVDAAVATAAALGVTEPYSAGVGGGGYFVVYDARSRQVHTIDGRETAPAGVRPDSFVDPATGRPYPFTPDLVTSGVSVGVPGTPATWQSALERWGTVSLRRALEPATRLAERGFTVDDTFALQTRENAERFRTFTSSTDLFLPGPGATAPAVGSRFRNPDLARTYRELGRRGVDWLYRGALGAEVARTVQAPPLSGATDLPVPVGTMTTADLAGYRAVVQRPTRVAHRGYDVYGMAPSSSGGTTVGEALNILAAPGAPDLAGAPRAAALHRYLEASALAFADRGRYVGDPAFADVPTRALLDPAFDAERACLIDPARAAAKPVAAGEVTDDDGRCDAAPAEGVNDPDTENLSTTHLSTADRWGNVVSYTLTIEQTGGSGIVVPGRGFLLNNELTDFTTVYDAADPNRLEPGKRPRSSMAPTIVLRHGRPVLAVGSPGGSTIITTVLQVLLNRLDLGLSLPEAVAAPRASQRNTASVTAEQAFIDADGAALGAYGHTFTPAGAPGTSAAEIGAVAAIELGPGGRLTAVAEPVRRGGGSAQVVRPRR